ncbi:MAG: LEA type 2 family protein [Spirochaetaceae bacterium]
MKERPSLHWAILLTAVVVLSGTGGCALLEQFLRGEPPEKPTARITGARVEAISFSEVDMVFDLEVSNPNEIEVSLAGFDYDLQLSERPFLNGSNEEGLTLSAGGSATIELPVTLVYQEVFELLTSVPEDRETPYAVEVGFTFEVPGLGNVRVAADREGTIPVVELPSLRLGSLRMEAADFSGASMLLTAWVENPNSFGGQLREVRFSFLVDNSPWTTGELTGGYEVAPRSTTELEIPIYVDFVALGRSARRLLLGETEFPYQLEGSAVIAPEWELLGPKEFSFDLTGTARLR